MKYCSLVTVSDRKVSFDYMYLFTFLGELNKLRIEHDNSGFRPAWFLERIEIVNMATNNTSVFPCSNWLDKNKGDKSTCRDLLPRD